MHGFPKNVKAIVVFIASICALSIALSLVIELTGGHESLLIKPGISIDVAPGSVRPHPEPDDE